MNLHTISPNFVNVAFCADDKKADKKPNETTSEKIDAKKQPKESQKVQQTAKNDEILDDFVKDTTTPVDVAQNVKSKGKSIKKFVGNSIDTWQKFLKFKARASEYVKGTFNGVVAGLGVGAAIMSFDWAMKGVARIAKKEATASMYIKEPAGLVTKSFGKVFKGLYHLPDLTIKEIVKNTLHSPIDLFKYVKDAKNVSKVGKVVAPLAGGAAMAYCLGKAVLKANQRIANIEHAFNSGHAHDLK